MPAEISRIAAFMEIAIDESTWDAILEHCSFQYMKAHSSLTAPFGGELWEGGGNAFMHKGTNDRWNNMLTAEDISQYERVAAEQLGPACAHWLATGILPE